MITYGIDEDEAFALLRWHSQHNNIKLRDVAFDQSEPLTRPTTG